ncbi:hypothetical protein C9J48_11835 [Photobacterium profundum]|uniref:ABC-type transport auxiliary lipoprotein component domain-containing protein n=1 Tax=Photobacterium profundum 3TCK TaxID=314280 RepID=Q1YZ30_9GAMM|nr:ABC-type transport auxiliary lipoprotein family protein [Photobacterium profundum]EAS41511.1 hypothetical protein P3TCK_07711 [Photobacterium profundum 3TCK]PSV62632.1 hypothetical protein C9J48_11835 [Photobacterium profundum]
MKKHLLFMVAATAFLAGCSSQPDAVNSYLLPAGAQSITSQIGSNQPLLVIRPVEMAEHLAGTGLVYQVSDTEVVQAQQNLWAESIGKQLTRRINQDLRNKQSQFWTTELTPALSTYNSPRLQVKIDEFNGHYSGMAKISGEWMLVKSDGDLNGVYPFKFQVPLQEEGYDAQVKALSEGINRLTTQIAKRLNVAPASL